NQAHGSPANLIDLYAAVDIPEGETFGISDFDIPGLRKDSIRKKNDGDPTILKYATSAANITGKPLTSAETFTWLTEHFRTSLSQCKPEIDQMFTAGINHVYFHGSTYSPKEAAWPGWKFYASVDMSPTNTLWKDAPAFFNYVTRVQSFLQNTKPDNDFLLYFPVYDTWAEQRGAFFTTFAIHGLRERLPEFCNLAEKIMQSGFDPDYISDTYIKTTTLQNGELQTQGGSRYKAIVVPSVKIIPPETLSHLLKLAEEGATVIFTDHYPEDVPGLKDLSQRQTALKDMLTRLPAASFREVQTHPFGKGKLITGPDDFLDEFSEGKEPFKTGFGGQLIRKKHEDGHLYFMAMLKNITVDGWVPLSVSAASALIFDPMTGKTGRAALRKNKGQTEVYLQLNTGQSLILKTFSTAKVKAENWPYYAPTGNMTELRNGWELSFPESEPEVKEHFRPESPGSWTELEDETLKTNAGTGKYILKFDLQKKEDREYLLTLGDVRESARVKVNGQGAGTLFAVPFEINVGSLLKTGENTLEVEVTNLPANRIRDYDRRGIHWRRFHEINFVSITYKNTKFDQWEVMPSGLLGPVTLREMQRISPE
ncbi:MAG: glycoside hydrolase, partial [Leadbetterella sp.]|nr:glycoside hydrolase [Leadbetterella sp.]